MDAWPASTGEAIHTSTFLGHPLSCTVAAAVLDAIQLQKIPDQASWVGKSLLEGVREQLAGVAGIVDIRGLGLLLGIEFVEEDGLSPDRGRGARIAEEALAEGLVLLPGGDHGHVLELTPSASLTEAQAEYAVDTIASVIRRTPSVRLIDGPRSSFFFCSSPAVL